MKEVIASPGKQERGLRIIPARENASIVFQLGDESCCCRINHSFLQAEDSPQRNREHRVLN